MSARLTGRRLLTVAGFAAATGIPAQTVREQLRAGRLRGRDLNAGKGGRVRARWSVLASEVARLHRIEGG